MSQKYRLWDKKLNIMWQPIGLSALMKYGLF